MKLKYYLRGIGLGIIFATIVMAVSSGIHNNNLSNEFIIKEAQKLGMIMPDEEEDGGLWDTDTEEDASETENLNGTESLEGTETSDETQTNMEESDETEGSGVSDTVDDVANEDETTSEVKIYHTITITDYDAARHVGEKLQEKGLVSSAEEFRQYVRDQGDAYRIRTGTFEIPEGATLEEICDIIVR